MTAAGRVFWLTGLAGAGKTTLAGELTAELRRQGRSCVMLDGDALRVVLGAQKLYSRAERLELALTYSRLCKLLSDQGFDVVCATVSLFHAVQSWNRENLSHYTEVVLQVPAEVLHQRDQKGLYSGALKGNITEVMGLDLSPEWPRNPDVVLINDGSQDPRALVLELLDGLKPEA
ncbi:MAG: adenylyl-sulfate kinase [Candidatus Sericytochromatia bacterium]